MSFDKSPKVDVKEKRFGRDAKSRVREASPEAPDVKAGGFSYLGKIRSRGGKLVKPRIRGPGPVAASSEAASVPAGLIDPYAVYRFRLPYIGSFNSDGAGLLRGYISLDPGTTSYAEFSTLSAIFSEVRLHEAQIILSAINPHADGYATGYTKAPLYVSWDDTTTGSNPGSSTLVMEKNNSWVWHLASTDSLSAIQKCPNRQWATTVTPSPGPYAGCTGYFGFYQSNLTLSVPYFYYLIYATFEFRNRT